MIQAMFRGLRADWPQVVHRKYQLICQNGLLDILRFNKISLIYLLLLVA